MTIYETYMDPGMVIWPVWLNNHPKPFSVKKTPKYICIPFHIKHKNSMMIKEHKYKQPQHNMKVR